ncbi:hypothetical protein [Herbidospora cretacea]|uniref:hypothetical protein n=1 Tax=Herbidospora cretacea TaxID=28444 RepID=UPI0012DCCF41|nr:hypothetical protein [Herbidospora cretacea]
MPNVLLVFRLVRHGYRVNVHLIFSEVDRLYIERDEDCDQQAGASLERIVHRIESGQSKLEIDARDWQRRFNASRVAVESEIQDFRAHLLPANPALTNNCPPDATTLVAAIAGVGLTAAWGRASRAPIASARDTAVRGRPHVVLLRTCQRPPDRTSCRPIRR